VSDELTTVLQRVKGKQFSLLVNYAVCIHVWALACVFAYTYAPVCAPVQALNYLTEFHEIWLMFYAFRYNVVCVIFNFLLLSAMLNLCSYRLIWFFFFPELFVLFTFFFKLLHFLLLIF